jgi:hypothetical protein
MHKEVSGLSFIVSPFCHYVDVIVNNYGWDRQVAVRDACSSVGIASRRFSNKTSIADSAHRDTVHKTGSGGISVALSSSIHENTSDGAITTGFRDQMRILFEHLPCNHQNTEWG